MWAMIEKLRMLAAGAAMRPSSMAMRQTPSGLVAGTDMDVVKAVFAAFAERDVEGVLAHAETDIVFSAVTGDYAGRTDPYRGHDGMRQYFRDVAEVWDELRIVPRRLPPERRHDPRDRAGQRPLPGPNGGGLDRMDLASGRPEGPLHPRLPVGGGRDGGVRGPRP